MRNNHKTFYIANFILIFTLLLISFGISVAIIYEGEHKSAIQKTDLLTEQVNENLDDLLNRLNATSRSMFLNEGFQNLADKIYEDDQAILDIYDHFSLYMSMEDYFTNAIYIPRTEQGELDNLFYLSSNYSDFVLENIDNLISTVEKPEYENGKAFFLKIYFNDGIYSHQFAIGRSVTDIRQSSYFEKIGAGFILFNDSILTDALNSYAMAFDGLEFYITDSTQVLFSSKGIEGSNFEGNNYYSKRLVVDQFSWNLVGLFDKSYVWRSMSDSVLMLLIAMVVVNLVYIVLIVLLKRKTTKSLDYLFNTFSRFKKDSAIEIVEHSTDEEVNQVIDSFNEMVNSVRNLNDEMLKQKNRELALELRNVEYMLNSLHAQINKHFMINVLSLLRSFIYCGETERAKKCIEDLSDFLRSALTIDDTCTVGDEISMVRSYLSLQTSRYPNVEVEIDCKEEYYDLVIPKMILQPIIENAFIHGLQKKTGKIKLVCRVRVNFVTFFVIDNGLGMDSDRLRAVNLDLRENKKKEIKIGNGIALHNIKQRLRLISTQKSSIRAFSKKGQGTIVVLRIYRGE